MFYKEIIKRRMTQKYVITAHPVKNEGQLMEIVVKASHLLLIVFLPSVNYDFVIIN